MTIQDQREATRALRGHTLRQEVYADDGTPQAGLPYLITEQNYNLQSASEARRVLLAPCTRNRKVFRSE